MEMAVPGGNLVGWNNRKFELVAGDTGAFSLSVTPKE